jgi:hypothetical protein
VISAPQIEYLHAQLVNVAAKVNIQIDGYDDLEQSEWIMHELGHWFALGCPVLPKDRKLNDSVADKIQALSGRRADFNEAFTIALALNALDLLGFETAWFKERSIEVSADNLRCYSSWKKCHPTMGKGKIWLWNAIYRYSKCGLTEQLAQQLVWFIQEHS